jgi:hypothetical protein
MITTTEPILEYCKARRDQLNRQADGPEKAIALDELNRIIVLCEGLLKQQNYLRDAFAKAGVQLP